jgi:hypothetical protein
MIPQYQEAERRGNEMLIQEKMRWGDGWEMMVLGSKKPAGRRKKRRIEVLGWRSRGAELEPGYQDRPTASEHRPNPVF